MRKRNTKSFGASCKKADADRRLEDGAKAPSSGFGRQPNKQKTRQNRASDFWRVLATCAQVALLANLIIT